MQVLNLEAYWIIGPILIIAAFSPVLYTLFILAEDEVEAPRTQRSKVKGKNLFVKLKAKGKYYHFPIEDISRIGLSFNTEEIPEQLLLEQGLTVKVYCDKNKIECSDLASQLTYMHKDVLRNNVKVGLKFEKAISNQMLSNIIKAANYRHGLNLLQHSHQGKAKLGNAC